jgi:hypothetical protein
MAGGFPEVPALRAAYFARCCTAPLRSLIYHCVHLLPLLSLSLCLPRRSPPCCRVVQFYVGPQPALVVCFLPSVIRIHAQVRSLWFPLLDVNGLGHGYGAWHGYMVLSQFSEFAHIHVKCKICGYMVLKYTGWDGGSARLSLCQCLSA